MNLIKTAVGIKFPGDNKDYTCFYDKASDRCYYQVNEEYLLIADKGKTGEIKKWFEENQEELWKQN